MDKSHHQLQILGDTRAQRVLLDLHRKASRQNMRLVGRFLPQLHRLMFGRRLPWQKLEPRMSDLYLAMGPDDGVLCYMVCRALQARYIVEFGSSYGVSTIYLALAVRDNGGGVVVATERVAAKAALAREHLVRAGIEQFVELRQGDARETLRDLQTPVDCFINDGFPAAALPVMQLVAPKMRKGAVALCGNTGLFPADHADYVGWVRDPQNGFCSTRWPAGLTGEFSVKVKD